MVDGLLPVVGQTAEYSCFIGSEFGSLAWLSRFQSQIESSRRFHGFLSIDQHANHTDSVTFFFANKPSVTAGSVLIAVNVDGQALLTFNDLAYNAGGQDRAFASNHPWPWHGVFTANQGGTLTRWDVTSTGSSGANCTVVVYATGAGKGTIVHP